MRKILLGVGVLLTLTSGLAMAGTIDLNWNACFTNLAPSPVKASIKTFACTSNTGGSNLVMSFYPTAEATTLDAMDGFIDYHLTTGIPCWWDFRSTNTLRAAALVPTLVDPFTCGTTTDQTCFGCAANWWSTQAGPSGGAGLALVDPTFGRITATVAIAQGSGTGALATGQEEFGFSLRILNSNSTVAAGCPGCLTPITLTFDHLTLFGPGVSQGDGTNSVQAVTYNQAQHSTQTTFNLNPTPTEKKTWGAIKAIYR